MGGSVAKKELVSRRAIKGLGVAALAVLFLTPGFASAQSDWVTWGHDPGRTGWNDSEKTLTKDNVSRLELKWKSQLSTAPREEVLSTLTAPLVATVAGPQGPRTRVFVVGSDNTVYAIDSETGEVSWKKAFPNTLTPPKPPTWLCPDTQNATPVIDKDAGIIYVATSDGKLRGLSLANGEDRMPATAFTDPYARNWSLNLVDGVIYSSNARGCGNAEAHLTAMDLKDPSHRVIEYYTGTGRPSGVWGRGSVVAGPKALYMQTADGPYDPAAGSFGDSVLAVTYKKFRLLDSYTPTNWSYLREKDLDLGSANPVLFAFQKWTLVASAGKESTISLLDADNLGGADHHTPLYQSPRWGNDEILMAGRGLWGAMATWQDADGKRFLLLPLWGPPSKDAPAFKYSYGPSPAGSVMAFEVSLDPAKNTPMLVPTWMSRDMQVPDPPAVANGVVYVLQTGENTVQRASPKVRSTPVTNAVLYALDGETGKELYSSDKAIDSWTHFSEPVVADGRVYVSTWDGRVYAFGLKK
jgi:outer membrane protein assembly factor BamB